MNVRLSISAAAFALGLAFACSDDEGSGGKGSEAGGAGEAAGGSPEAGSSATQAGSGGADETGLGGAGALVERGEYLVKHVSVCTDCHTPIVNGVPDMTKFLAGTDCLFDAIPGS